MPSGKELTLMPRDVWLVEVTLPLPVTVAVPPLLLMVYL